MSRLPYEEPTLESRALAVMELEKVSRLPFEEPALESRALAVMELARSI